MRSPRATGNPRFLGFRAPPPVRILITVDETGSSIRPRAPGRSGVTVRPVTSRPYLIAAVLLTATGELEAALGTASEGERLVSMLALPAVTVPLAWARSRPLAVLATMAAALVVQAALGGFLVGSAVTTLAALALAFYAAGHELESRPAFGAAAALGVVVATTRVMFDPAARSPRDAVLTYLAVATPLLVGRWARGQSLLRRELADRVARRARDRERDARHAAEEERARIATDLQTAVAGGLRSVMTETAAVRRHLRTGDHEGAEAGLAGTAAIARAALADVRRVLGVLRHEGDGAPLSPPGQVPSPPGLSVPAILAAAPADPAAREPARWGPHGDLLLASAVLVLGAVDLAVAAPAGQQATAPLTAVAIAAPLAWRRAHPLPVALAVLAAIALQSLLLDLGSFPVGDIAAMVVAGYSLGAFAERRTAVAGVLITASGAGAHAAVFYPEGVIAAVLGGAALPWVVGRVVRSNRELADAGRRRSAEVERSREREARAAVTGERMRVARELHDAVAHNVSVIAIQAGSAEGLAARDPERTEQIVALIETVTGEALAELDRLGGVTEADAHEAPRLGQIDRLAERARAGGLAVEVHFEGSPATLPAGIDLAAFRIVQEALTNTTKHARAERAWVKVRYAPRAVELEIGDHGPGGRRLRRTPREGGGHGLVGMRERVALYHGSLDTGPRPGGGYLVRARIPVEH